MTNAQRMLARRNAILEALVSNYQQLTVVNAQMRHTESGQYRGNTPSPEGTHEAARMGWGPHVRESFESPDEELHEDDASSMLVGKEDGNGVGVPGRGDTMQPIAKKGTAGTAGEDDDENQPNGPLPASKIKSRDSKGQAQPMVVVGNEEIIVVGNEHIGFKALSDEIAGEKNPPDDPDAVAAAIGREKYGAKGMAKKAAKGKKAATKNAERASGTANAADIKAEVASASGKSAATPKQPKGMGRGGMPAPAAAGVTGAPQQPADNEDEETTNLDSSYTTPTGGPTKMDPHDMTKQAAGASLHSEHDGAFGLASQALKHSGRDNHEKASDFHEQAADAHQEAATDARKRGDSEEADLHDNAAAMHSKAASMHDAACTENRGTRNMAPKTITRRQAVRMLTANCTCQKDVQALNGLSNETLGILLRNAKMDSSNADSTGSGTRQAGGEEDDDEDGEAGNVGSDSDEGKGLRDDVKVGDKGVTPKFGGKSNATENWLRQQPVDVQNAVRSWMERDRQEKVAIVRSITSNEERQQKLMRLTLPQLREQQALIQEAVANVQAQQQPYPNFDELTDNGFGGDGNQPVFAGAGAGPVVVNDAVVNARDTDVLHLPTMNSVIRDSASPDLLKALERARGA